MILAAALLVLLAVGLFVGGILTGVTVWYWACVGVSAVAAVLLIVARRQLAAPREKAPAREPETRAARAPAKASARKSSAGTPPRAETSEPAESPAIPAAAEPAPAESDESDVAATAEPAAPSTAGVPPEPAAAEPAAAEPVSTGAHAAAAVRGGGAHAAREDAAGEPPVEDTEVTDLLLVVDLKDEVFVIDEHPRYHLAACRQLLGHEAIPLPVDEARVDGFTPCGRCEPDRHLAEIERARKAARRG